MSRNDAVGEAAFGCSSASTPLPGSSVCVPTDGGGCSPPARGCVAGVRLRRRARRIRWTPGSTVTASRNRYVPVLSVTLSSLDTTPSTNVKRKRLPTRIRRTPEIAAMHPQPLRLLAFRSSLTLIPLPGIPQDHTKPNRASRGKGPGGPGQPGPHWISSTPKCFEGGTIRSSAGRRSSRSYFGSWSPHLACQTVSENLIIRGPCSAPAIRAAS